MDISIDVPDMRSCNEYNDLFDSDSDCYPIVKSNYCIQDNYNLEDDKWNLNNM
eukprot:jgi/Orpsp1_1/1174396/evm.model.c7180000049935.1